MDFPGEVNKHAAFNKAAALLYCSELFPKRLAFCVVAPNREEVEMLLSPLEPQYCVEQAMNAILIDQPLVCIPRLTYLPVISRAYVEKYTRV